VSTRIFDVALVGAGVFGAWTAYQLRRSGKSAVLIDAHGPANSLSSSGDESRIIRMGYGADEIYTRSALRSLKLWKEFSAETSETLFHQTGVLWLAHADDPYPEKTYDTLQKVGIAFERLTTDEVARRFPQVGLEGIAWAMLEPESGVLLARCGVQAVVREAIRKGVEYLEETVTFPSVKRKLDRVATANGRQISAGDFVFACGPWLPKIFPDLLADRIHTTRQEVFYFDAPAKNRDFAPPNLPTWIDFKDEMYSLPDIDGHGIKIAIDRHGEPFDAESGDRTVTENGLAEVRRCLARRLPDLKDAPLREARVCQYENTSNGDFLIDRHPEFENVWLVGGGSGHGFKHGPVVGEYVAARIDGSKEGIEPRFSLETKGRARKRRVY
jgi:sarcosine oxidase